MACRGVIASSALALLSACTFTPLLPALGGDTGFRDDFDATNANDAGGEDAGANEDADPSDRSNLEDAAGDAGIADDGVDVDAGGPFAPIPHLAEGEQIFGTGDLDLAAGFINTDTLTVPATSLGTSTFDAVAQSPSGPELAVLRVGTLKIPGGKLVRVAGERPLVIVAAGAVMIDGMLDASARLDQYGAGGSGERAGDGRGGDGNTLSPFADSGGGGASYGGLGAGGGFAENMIVAGGVPGVTFGDAMLTILIGGSGGGRGQSGDCMPALGGGGGGAIEIYSAVSIRIKHDGYVAAGGGGARGGVECNTSNAGAGSGGGSGGAIYLIAPLIDNDGAIAANGGGGSGGGSSGSGMNGSGDPGANGGHTTTAAAGGLGGGPSGEIGGAGATRIASAVEGAGFTGSGNEGGNGGGGGGGVGRIVIVTAPLGYTNTGTVTPSANATTR